MKDLSVENKRIRHEYKFLLDEGAYLEIRDKLRRVMSIDANTISGTGYHIRSLYFDDIYDTAVREKIMGYLYRRKFRIRIYDFSDRAIKLEIKEKVHDYINKQSCSISRDEFNRILGGEISFLYYSNNSVKKRYYSEFRNNLLRPKVIVDYAREAYTLPYNQVRITFDKNLSSAKPQKNIFTSKLPVTIVEPQYRIILEVKYNNFFPGHLRAILETHSLNRLAVSKYVICRENLVK